MAAELDSKQLQKIANANLGSADITKDHAESLSSTLVAPGTLISGVPKVPSKASPRKGSFVEKLKKDSENANSPRKNKTPPVSPLLSFLKNGTPPHLDLATSVTTQHFDSGSSDSAQPHTGGKVKIK